MSRPNVRWNLIANFGGQAWRALMSLLFVPFYLHILGVEAYGLIGLYTSLLMALALLDAGLRPTLAREMARFTGGGVNIAVIRTLLRSVELPLFAIAGTIVAIMFAAAPFLATNWIHPQLLTKTEVAGAFAIMGLVAGAQFVEAAYDSCLSGLQRQVLQNAVITTIATLRGFGALCVLWISPHITSFFLWQGFVALLSLLLLRAAVYRSLPPLAEGVRVRFSVAALREVRSYAAGMLGIAIISLLLTQSDKILLARFMPLADVGRYALAAALAGTLSFLSTPVAVTFNPRLTQLIEQGDQPGLARNFHLMTRLTVIVVGIAAAMMALFGNSLLNLWIHDPVLSAEVAPILALLAVGTFLNALSFMPYALQIAHGFTSLTLRINLVVLLAFIPSLFILVGRYGATGAASCWVMLNAAALIASAWFGLGRFLPHEAGRWWGKGVVRPLIIIIAVGLPIRLAVADPSTIVARVLLLGVAGGAMVVVSVLADRELRTKLFAAVSKFRMKGK